MAGESTILMTPRDAQKMQSLLRMVSNLRGGHGIVVSAIPGVGVTINLTSSPGSGGTGGGSIQQFRVKTINNNYLTCRTWDGVKDGVMSVNVAKPYLLRHDKAYYPDLANLTTVNAQSVTADPTAAGLPNETWVVSSSYVVDGVIFGCIPVGGVGVILNNSGGTVTPPLSWLDLNVDGRVWGFDCN